MDLKTLYLISHGSRVTGEPVMVMVGGWGGSCADGVVAAVEGKAVMLLALRRRISRTDIRVSCEECEVEVTERLGHWC
jgi:hypothetical protein